MVRLLLAICAFAMLAAPRFVGAATTSVVSLPLQLLTRAHSAGSSIESAEIVDAPQAGIFDRSGGLTLQIGRAAFEAATSLDEKNALLAIALSHRIGIKPPTRPDGANVGDALQDVLAAGLDEGVAARDRADPYLKQPTVRRPRQRQPDAARPRGDATILRGLAWARAAGVCEKVSVDLLTRLASAEPRNGPVAMDARSALKALGTLGFAPDERC